MQSLSLIFLLVVPLIGALLTPLMPCGKSARNWALAIALLTLGVGVWMVCDFLQLRDAAQMLEFGQKSQGFGVPLIGFSFHLGADSISLWLVMLTVFLHPLAIAASFRSIQERQKEYYGWMLALLVAMLGVFLSRDLLLFYIFFELTLIPMFFIIGIWGGPERRYAAGKFFLFTFSGSVFTLAAVVYLGMKSLGSDAPSFDLNDIVHYAQSGALSAVEKRWLVLGLLAGFAVKIPLFPVHTWLPLAHTEAPTAGSVILAGVLLKLGTYGLLRLALPIGLVDANGQATYPELTRVLAAICVVGIIYGALVAWVQRDIKKLVAYSSVSHLGFCVLGLLALNDIGMQGSVLYMINHGLSTGAMFLVIGMIYDRFHTRDINELSGLGKRMPIMAFFFIYFVMASIGLPGLNGFWSEFLTLQGAFTSSVLGKRFGAVGALGVILGAVYMLHMSARIIFGPLKAPGVAGDNPDADPGSRDSHGHSVPSGAHADQWIGHPAGQSAVQATGHATVQGSGHSGGHAPDHSHADADTGDLRGREIAILVPLALAVLLLGVQPNQVLKSVRGPVQSLRLSNATSLIAGSSAVHRTDLSAVQLPGTPLRTHVENLGHFPEKH